MADSELSVQLYTVRDALARDLPATLTRLASIGFSRVEPFGIDHFPELGQHLKEADLSAPTAHVHFVGVDDIPLFDLAQKLGVQTLIEPAVDADRWRTVEGVIGVAQDMNAAAKRAAGFGLRLAYHNHPAEVESVFAGKTALEIFADHLDEGVYLQVDTYWVAAAGHDPVALLQRLGDRVVAIHIKDGPATHDDIDQVAVGKGNLPIVDIVNAAQDALRVIELDDSRGDLMEAVADSFAFLRSVGLS